MGFTRVLGGLAFAALLVQTGNGESVAALAVEAPEPPSISQPEFDQFLSDVREASAQWFHGHNAQGRDAMTRAFEGYANAQRARYPTRELSPVEQDVLEIRDAVRDPINFKTLGIGAGPAYRAAVLDPKVEITLSNRVRGTVTIRRPLPNRPWTIYLETDRIRQLERILGDLDASPWPDGGEAVSQLWRQFLGVDSGHMQRWSVRANPAVRAIAFLNAKRTRAEVSVFTSDASGARALFEKHGGQWMLIKLTQQWIA